MKNAEANRSIKAQKTYNEMPERMMSEAPERLLTNLPASSPPLAKRLTVGTKAVYKSGKVLIADDFKASLYCQQPLGLLKMLVVGAEHHRYVPHGSFKHIVNAHAEAATHVCHAAIAIDG